MAKKNKEKGGSFFSGVLIGLFFSAVVFVGLTLAFPVKEEAPMAAMDAPVQTAPQVFDVGADDSDDSGVSVGNTTDSAPVVSAGGGLDDGAPAEQPVVATESAAVPDIGDGTNSQTDATPDVADTPEPVNVDPQPEEVASSEAAPSLPDAESGEAFEVFSVPFTPDEDLPMVAIVFEDTLEASLEKLFDAGIPLNFAVSGTSPDPQISRSFRESGFEVLTLLPENMEIDENLSVNIDDFISNVPASIALIDNKTGGVMNDTEATQIMIETAAVNGMGTIAFAGAGDTHARNLSRFYRKPFGNVHQIVDESADVAEIKAALDNATLAAQSSGSAIIYARTRETTIRALLEWLASSRAERVQIVPISQIMRPN